jgi:2-keto-3-deoxy-L-rhamnonate aldolase RhmA
MLIGQWGRSRACTNTCSKKAWDTVPAGKRPMSMGYTGEQGHPEVQQLMERGVKMITEAGRIAGCSCPDMLIRRFLGLGVQYFHSTVGRLLQQSSDVYLQTMRQATAHPGK